jgi:hypothetical protein
MVLTSYPAEAKKTAKKHHTVKHTVVKSAIKKPHKVSKKRKKVVVVKPMKPAPYCQRLLDQNKSSAISAEEKRAKVARVLQCLKESKK